MTVAQQVLVGIIVVWTAVSSYLVVDKVHQIRGVQTAEMRAYDHTPLPPPFKAAVDKIIQETLAQERARNVSLYVTNGTVVSRSQTVVGTQSNLIVQLVQKVGL